MRAGQLAGPFFYGLPPTLSTQAVNRESPEVIQSDQYALSHGFALLSSLSRYEVLRQFEPVSVQSVG